MNGFIVRSSGVKPAALCIGSIVKPCVSFKSQKNQNVIQRKCVVNVKIDSDTAAAVFDKKSGKGRATYRPKTFDEMVRHATESIEMALADGHNRLEVEFPPVPGNTDGYKGASDLFIDSNCQLALAAAKQLAASGRRIHLVVSDEGELNRSKKMFEGVFQLNPNITIGCLTGSAAGSVWGALGTFLKAKGTLVEPDEGAKKADMYIILNATTVEIATAEDYCNAIAGDKPVILWNLELDTLRSDLGLFAFPPKDLQYRFLSKFLPVFYIRTRDYSKSVAVAPFVINYSGALFREYPGPWQVMLRQDNGELACIAEDKTRYTLGEFKEELMQAMGLNTEAEGSADYFLRRGYKVSTWWEDDVDKEESNMWRK